MDCVAVPQVVGDYGVDVGQHKGIVGADHVFRCHAVLVLFDDYVESDPSLAYANRAPFVDSEWGTIGMQGKHFVQVVLVQNPRLRGILPEAETIRANARPLAGSQMVDQGVYSLSSTAASLVYRRQ
jgi:hypothetical protein